MSIRTPRKRQATDKKKKRKKKRMRKRQHKKHSARIMVPASPIKAIPGSSDIGKAADADQTQADNIQETSFKEGYAKGFHEGKYAGGEEIIDRLLPANVMLPEVSVEQIIAAGVNVYREHAVPLLPAEQVGEAIIQALDEKRPLSLVRLGDGELLTLAQEVVMPVESVRREGKFLEYAGVIVPDMEIRNRLAEAVIRANIVGIPRTRMPNYQLLVAPVFRAYGISYGERNWTDSLINYELFHAGYLLRMLQHRRILVIGNMAEPLSAVLAGYGIVIAGIISPVNGARDATRIVQLARQYEFDLALVSAGIAAVLIAEELARVTGKVVIDFGHLANAIVKGEAILK